MDGEDVSKIKNEEDPFWDEPEDVLIGTANVFLQSLSYALDFDDKLSVTDYKVRSPTCDTRFKSIVNSLIRPLQCFFVDFKHAGLKNSE